MANPNKPRTSRQLQAEATRKNIADTALRLFSEQGVSKTTTRLIAQEAGVSEGLIYHHFPDKAALMRAVSETRTMFGLEVVRLLDGAAGQPIAEVFQGIATLFSKLVVAGTTEAQLFNLLLAESRSMPELHALFVSVLGRVDAALVGYLEGRVCAGEVRGDADLSVAAQTTVGGLLLFFMRHSNLSEAQWKRKAPNFAAEHMRMMVAALAA